MASSEVSEVFTSSFEDERTLNAIQNADNDLYGSEDLIVSAADDVQTQEIVGGLTDSLNDVYVPTTSELAVDLIKKENCSTNNRKIKKKPSSKNGLESLFHSASDLDKETTWQQKRVSIKTLEGEFSVTMWASGAEDGRTEFLLLLLFIASILVRKVSLAARPWRKRTLTFMKAVLEKIVSFWKINAVVTFK